MRATGITLAQPVDHWLRKSFESGVGLTAADLDLLGDCMNAMESVASHLDESTGYFVTHGRLLERLSEAEKDLDRRIVDNLEAERRNALSQPIGAEHDSGAETMVASAFVTSANSITAEELFAPESDAEPEHMASAAGQCGGGSWLI